MVSGQLMSSGQLMGSEQLMSSSQLMSSEIGCAVWYRLCSVVQVLDSRSVGSVHFVVQ